MLELIAIQERQIHRVEQEMDQLEMMVKNGHPQKNLLGQMTRVRAETNQLLRINEAINDKIYNVWG